MPDLAASVDLTASGTRARLLAAAARVFVRRGFDGTTVREIAEEAGFTNPVLYYHFESKERLYQAVIQGSFERFERLTGEALATTHAPLERLGAFAAACLAFARQDPVRLRILYQEIFRPSKGDSKDLDVSLQSMRAYSRSKIGALLADLDRSGSVQIGDLPLATRVFVALLNGLLLEQARDPDQPLVEEALANAVILIFLRGLEGLGRDR